MNNNSYIHIFIQKVKRGISNFRPFGVNGVKTDYSLYYIFITVRGPSKGSLKKGVFMKKFAAGLLTALCATAFSFAQEYNQATVQYTQDYSQTEWDNAQPATQTVDTYNASAPAATQPTVATPQAAPAAPQETAVAPAAAPTQNDETMPIDEQPTIVPKKKQPISIGARASFIYGNFWGFKNLDDLEEPSGFGADFAITTRFAITKGLSFSPEIAFRLLYLEHGDEDYTRNFDMTFLDFAFYVQGEISSSFYLEVGPQLSINTSGDYTIESDSETFDIFENIEQSTVEFGINIGLGYHILDNLTVGFRWYMGFNEVFPDVKYYFEDITADDYDSETHKIKSSVKTSVSNLKGAHSMMFKLGLTYWFI